MHAILALKENFYDRSIEAAKSENHADFISVYENIKKQAEEFKTGKMQSWDSLMVTINGYC